jgi:carboxyl-terminal processing protease
MKLSRQIIKEYGLTVLLLLASLAGAFFLGYLFRGYTHPGELTYPILAEARDLLVDNGLYPLPEGNSLEYGMIHGMISAYDDPYTRFLEPPENELDTDNLSGRYGGIGASLERDDQNRIRLYPFDNSPAEAAGIWAGDLLISVDGTPINAETSTDDAVALLRGPEGEKVKVEISRPVENDQHYEFSIVRMDFPLPSVTIRVLPEEPRIGIIGINRITSTSVDELIAAIMELQNQEATHFILDLRDNGGGLLEPGVEIARLFLSDGLVIQQQYRDQPIKDYSVTKEGQFSQLPLVVFINGNSASAAEVIAGALQAQSRAALIGQTSFGKNTVQLVLTLRDSSSLHVTAAKWWIPGIEFPGAEGNGLIPDIPTVPDGEIPAAILYFFGEEY